MTQQNQLVVSTEKFAGEENMSPVQIQTMSEDIEEHLKLAHKLFDNLDRASRKICVTKFLYNAGKPKITRTSPILCNKDDWREVPTNRLSGL